MNAADKNPLLRQIFEEAAQEISSPREPNVPHLIDNDDLLTRWTLDQLRPPEHEQIVQHLASCGRCRTEVATLLREGVLELPQQEEAERPRRNIVPATEMPERLSIKRWRMAGWGAAVLAAAAAIVIAMVLWQPRAQFQSELAKASKELNEGNAGEARERLGKLLDGKSLADEDRQLAMTLFEKASIAQAQKALADKNYGTVAEIERDAVARGIQSGRLANMKIQADRNMPVQVAMLDKGTSLLDYDYRLDGSAFKKDVQVPDERIARELKEAVEQHPEEVDLLLNRGQFLLDARRFEEAHQAFLDAHNLEPRNVLAILGMGLADYVGERFKSALDRFDEALKIDPENVQANLNKAICLEKLDQHADAVKYFNEARRLTSKEELRTRIDAFLQRTP